MDKTRHRLPFYPAIDMARDESVDTADHEHPLPDIADDDDFSTVIKKLSMCDAP